MATGKFPALFIGHGSPMNALADNTYTRDIAKAASELPVPEGIVVISAHWHSAEPSVTGSPSPEQIYDFYGFPDELYRLKYKAPGSPEIAAMAAGCYAGKMNIDNKRGIDHAAWAMLLHMYPEQKIPVLEMSIDYGSAPRYCYEQGKRLRRLRGGGILFIGSGNMVHNLSLMKYDEDAEPYPWAGDFDLRLKEYLLKCDVESIAGYRGKGDAALKSVPTPDHYLPMLYVLGLMEEGEKVKFIHESMQNGSVSMRSFRVG